VTNTSLPPISATSMLKNQLVLLTRLVERTRFQLDRMPEGMVPENVLDGLTQLTDEISQVERRIVEEQAELRNLRALADIGQVVNSSLDISVVLQIVMDTIIRLTGAERGFLMLRNEKRELAIRIARNWEQESINPSEFAISSTIINRVVNDGQPVLTTNAQEDPRFGGQESIIAYNLRSILCVPLTVKSELTGVIYADNRIRSGLFTEMTRDLLVAFANQAAVAIENARLFASVSRTLAEVTELKNLMDNVFASIASGVITADIRNQVTLSNRAAETILGCPRKDLIGRRLEDAVPPIMSGLQPHLAKVRQTDQPVIGLELTSELPQRGNVDLRFNLSPLKDAAQTTQGIAIVLDDLTERRRLEGLQRLFERMVSPAVIEQLDPNSLPLGGERSAITTLFADIRGFTSYSERVDPEQLVSVLNRYLASAAEAVLAQEGTIDKFMGDAIMAWFNAPIPQPDHTLRAVRAALAIRSAVEKLHQEFPPEANLSFGVGIHYGEAVLGLVGTEKHLEYTAVGDSINTAKRVQENSNEGQILLTEETYERVKNDVIVRPVEPIQAKGKNGMLRVYEVLGLNKPD